MRIGDDEGRRISLQPQYVHTGYALKFKAYGTHVMVLAEGHLLRYFSSPMPRHRLREMPCIYPTGSTIPHALNFSTACYRRIPQK